VRRWLLVRPSALKLPSVDIVLSASPIYRVVTLVVLPLAAGFGGVLLAKGREPDASEALAALAGAVIGVTGTHLGHEAGHRWRGTERKSPEAGAEVRLFTLASIVAGIIAFLLITLWHLSFAAVSALIAAVFGVVGVHIANEVSTTPRTWRGVGLLLIAIALIGGLTAILVFPESAEGWAAFAAATIGIGGTQVGHVRGYELGKAK
jgi:hypothetical protein